MIPEFERVVLEAKPFWFLMENVPEAPPPVVDGYRVDSFCLNNRWLGGSQNRLRRISFGSPHGVSLLRFMDWPLFDDPRWEETVCASDFRRARVKIGSSGKVKKTLNDRPQRSLSEALELQGLGPEWDAKALTKAGKITVIGTGTPLPMAYALAKAIKCIF